MSNLIKKCKRLRLAYETGELGQTIMPEDAHPANFRNQELCLAYFTLPMALNYQRDSYKLWHAALKTFNDSETKIVFDCRKTSNLDFETLRSFLTRYKLALQPNKHPQTWQTISKTIAENWRDIEKMINSSDNDYLSLRKIIQQDFKKGFPYLSGPKIFNYWSFILGEFSGIKLKNRQFIEIAPDTHIKKCSIILEVITERESKILSREQISEKWRKALNGSGIAPIDMHAPLWFWSRNGFIFNFQDE